MRCALALLLLTVPWVAAPQTMSASASPPLIEEPAVAARVIVKFRQDAQSPREHMLAPPAGVRDMVELAAARANVLSARHGLALRAGRVLNAWTHVVHASGIDSESLARRLSRDADIEFAVVDQRRRRLLVPDDPLFLQGPAISGSTGGPTVGQWYLRVPGGEVAASINAPDAWDRTTGRASVVVAVLDTGVRPDHPDLANRLLPGYNFVSSAAAANNGIGRTADASDLGDWVSGEEASDPTGPFYGCSVENSSWHGTMIASLIGAAGGNGIGMAGVAWGIGVLPVRVLGKCGGYDSDIIAAMEWAAGLPVPGVPDNPTPAQVINMSLGQYGSCPASYLDALGRISSLPRPPVIVAAAGNSIGHAVGAPANCPGVMAVGGLRHVGTKVGFSDLGPEIALSAPAGNCVNTDSALPCQYPIMAATNTGATTPVASAYTDSFNFSVGTSLATPLVTGTVALMLSVQPAWTPVQVKAALQATVRPFPSSGVASDPFTGSIQQCQPPNGTDQLQCYCTTATCGAGMLDAGAAVALADASVTGPGAVIVQGWNLLGNGMSDPIAVTSAFSDAARVNAVWKWVAAVGNWAFYSPTFSDGGAAYAASRNYRALTTIDPGEGFWVDARGAFSLQLSGSPVPASTFAEGTAGSALQRSWNLISIGENLSPTSFANTIALNPPPAGIAVASSFATLWAWDAAGSAWYFFAPDLMNAGTLASYLTSMNYLDFGSRTLTPTTGFWVNHR